MAPIPSTTHNAGASFGWQMHANATKRPKKVYHVRKARSLRETNNLERLKCKLLERMYIFIYVYMHRTPWMELSWRPSSAERLFGNVELLGHLTCQIHVRWALQVACGSRCSVYLAIRGLHLFKHLKNHSVYSMKTIGTFSWKPDPIDLKCNFGTPRASKQQFLNTWSLYVRVLWPHQRWGLSSLWFTSHDSSVYPVLHSESFVHLQIVHGQLGWRDHLFQRYVPKLNLRNLLRVTWSSHQWRNNIQCACHSLMLLENNHS